MSQPAARAAAARSPSEPASAPMLRSSLSRAPAKPISPRITVADDRSATGSPAAPDRAPDRARGRSSRTAPPGRRGTAASRRRAICSAAASTTGRPRWLSWRARPWPGRCLITGSTPPARKPSIIAWPRRADQRRIRGEARDRRSRRLARQRQIEHRRAIDGDAERRQVGARSAGRAATPPRRRPSRSRSASWPIRRAGSRAGQCGGPRRATRPPS